MSDHASGYLLEIPYIAQFHREHAPIWFTATQAALGYANTSDQSTTWCEIGCGPGVGLIILAATNPSITFHGIDINPDAIRAAQALADQAQITNVVFHCGDLRAASNLPMFDYIVIRGIYSWVAPEIRDAIRHFSGQHLKSTGVALLHYLALPGAADFQAVHALFKAIHKQTGLPAREAVRLAQDILKKLDDGKAGFFATHPVAALKARQIASDDVDYTAHDLLNAFYEPLAVADIIAAMSEEGLNYIGSATPEENLDDFSVPAGLRDLFRAQRSPAMRETIRDMASNQFSRTDLYRQEAQPLHAQDHIAALRNLHFRAMPGAPGAGTLTFSTRIGPIEGPATVFSPILECVNQPRAVAYAEIEALPAFAGSPGIVNQALHALVGAGTIHPAPAGEPDSEPARRLNAVLIERHMAGQSVPALASPKLSSGLPVDPTDLRLLASGRDVTPAMAALLP